MFRQIFSGSVSSFALISGLMAGTSLAGSSIAMAQDSTTTVGTTTAKPLKAKKADTLEQVTVTANRRAQRAQDVAASLTVLNAQQLRDNPQIKRANDVVKFVPNASAFSSEGPERPRWFIRGIGTNSTTPNTVNPLGVYYDDIYIANVYNQGQPLYDLNRVEFLRGPQGTLWGKNANSGAVNYVSNPPTFKDEGYGTLGYGSNNEVQAQGALSGTVIPGKVAGRFAFYTDSVDGWQHNLYDGRDLGGGTDTAGRVQALIHANDDVDILLNVHFRRYDGTTLPQSYVADPTTNASGFGNPGTVYAPGYNHAGSIPVLPADEVDVINPGIEKLEEEGAAAKIIWTRPHYTITSITGYETNDRTQTTGTLAPPAGSSTAYSQSYTTGNYWQASEELHIASPAQNRFTWLGGLYGFAEHLDSANAQAYGASPVNAAGVSQPFSVAPYSNYMYGQDWGSYSAFLSLGYKITSRFKINSGVRWSSEDVSINDSYYATSLTGGAYTGPSGTGLAALAPGSSLTYHDNESHTYRSWTYDFTPEYKVSDNVNTYFRFAHGVMPGNYGFSGYASVPSDPALKAVQVTRINPESITAYEVGAKTQWFDNRLTVNGSIFNYDYDNALVNVPTTIGPGITSVVFRNAGSAYSRGIELQSDAVPISGLHIGGSIGLLTTKYTSEDAAGDGILGAQIPRSPHVSLNGYISYDQELPHAGDVLWAGDFNWTSKQYFFPTVANQQNDPLLAQGAYGVGNVHITWYPQDDHRLSFEGSVLNISDTLYKGLAVTPTNGQAYFVYGQPRTFFISVTKKFL
jgi:iron complex outermembrane receptor protein